MPTPRTLLDRTVLATLFLLALLTVSPAGAATPAGGSDGSDPESVVRQSLEDQVDQAVNHYTAGEFAAAEKLLAAVMRSDRASDRLRSLAAFNRGAALLQLDRYAEAVDAFNQAESETFPYPAQLHLARGIAWERMGRADMAAQDYSSALVANPTDPAVLRRVDAFFHKK